MIKVADLPNFDDDTTYIKVLKKEAAPEISIYLNHYYLIELEDYILNPPEGFSLHENWNNNIVPKHKYYKCQCIKIMGKMIKILGVAFDYENKLDLEDYWDGWLPLKSIKVLREI